MRSGGIIATFQSGGGTHLHADVGENPAYGISFVVVPFTQPRVPISYDADDDESDPGPFPIPLDAPIEGGAGSSGNRQVIAMQQCTCELFELDDARRTTDGWTAGPGARFDVRSNELRPLGWTSADAAGLAILPGLVRHEEVASGAIRHAIRVTFGRTQAGNILPATHSASNRSDHDLPPMELRLRLHADDGVALCAVSTRDRRRHTARRPDRCRQRIELVLPGGAERGWDDNDLRQLTTIPGAAFEVVDTGAVRS